LIDNKVMFYRVWRWARYVSITLLAVSSLVSVLALSHNSRTAKSLYDKLIIADQKDDHVQEALDNLKAYVFGHMNTPIGSATGLRPPIQLKGTYGRLLAVDKARVAAEQAAVYLDAQTICEAKYPDSFSGGPRVPCIAEYVTSHTSVSTPVPEGLYRFDFAPPVWSADTAGYSLLVVGACAISLLLQLVYYVFAMLIRRFYR
jgi:hypothetical protein